MKQKDIALIVVVAVVSLVLAVLLSSFLFSSSGSNRNLTAEKVKPIVDTFEQPSNKYFNQESIDPTETIRITNNENQTPFNQGN